MSEIKQEQELPEADPTRPAHSQVTSAKEPDGEWLKFSTAHPGRLTYGQFVSLRTHKPEKGPWFHTSHMFNRYTELKKNLRGKDFELVSKISKSAVLSNTLIAWLSNSSKTGQFQEDALEETIRWPEDPTLSFREGFITVSEENSDSNRSRELVKLMIQVINDSLDSSDDSRYYLAYAGVMEYAQRLFEAPRSIGQENDREGLDRGLIRCHNHWNAAYIGSLAGSLLQHMVVTSQKASDTLSPFSKLHSNFMPVMNSSGVGKSKALDEVGRLPGGPWVIGIVLRSGDDGGYPPGDPEIYDFLDLIKEERMDARWKANALALALVLGVFQAVAEWATKNGFLKKDTEGYEKTDSFDFSKMRSLFYEHMKPAHINTKKREAGKDSPKATFSGKSGVAEYVAMTRSEEKKLFIRNVLSNARLTFEGIMKSNTLTDSDISFMLEEEIKPFVEQFAELFEALLPEEREETEFLVFSVDEAGVLFESRFENENVDKDQGLLYNCIRRVFSGLVTYPVWCIPLSTRSNITHLLPRVDADPSLRVGEQHLVRFPAFTIFPMDVVMSRNLRHDLKKELAKSLIDYSKLSHQKTMGRILWDQFSETAPLRDVQDLVLTKLLNTTNIERVLDRIVSAREGTTGEKLIRQCFAMLSSRIMLDDCATTSEGADLIKESILSHLRLLKRYDPVTGVATGITPSEPLVAQAVSWLIIGGKQGIWADIINIVTKKLFYPGHVSKGVKGEFYVLLMLVLARDAVVKKLSFSAKTGTPPKRAVKTAAGSASLPRKLTQPLQPPVGSLTTYLEAAPYFSLEELLKALLLPKFFKSIWKATKAGTTSTTTFAEAFADAKLNFSHWTMGSVHLYGDKEPSTTKHGDDIRKQRLLLEKNEMLQLMLYRQAGMAMAVNQPEWDAALSMYLGEADQGLDYEKLSCLYIQTKNVANGFTPTKNKETKMCNTSFSHFPVKPDVPVLGLICNIGFTGAAEVRQLQHADPNVWYFDLRGNGAHLFNCLEGDDLQNACSSLLEVLIPEPEISEDLQIHASTYECFSRFTFAGQAGFDEKVRE
ncbi:hypothetical protein BJ508DRAFT_325883 [Ascobolus immersus RN42]|uniref:Uncharacterized protein n=1 Tax=Ascobolus immersus RN42 TaxID=1160509 RepID=A0A3N4I7R4_ASCIM|nr:hypothetical protein BJ508DRAFT_325883 [Ascobolus immersus RN42]